MAKVNNKIKKSFSDKAFNTVLLVICTFVLIVVAYPMIYLLSSSFSSSVAVAGGKVYLWPVEFNFHNYQWVFQNERIWIGYRNSIIYTVLGTILHLVMTICLAYPLSRKNYQAKPLVEKFLVTSMMIGGGLIPTFIVVSNLGLYNNPLWMVLNGAVGISNAIIMRTFFQTNVPYELLESAKLDGITDFGYLLKIVLPLSKAVISVICLYAVVAKWSSYMTPLLYLRNDNYYPLQVIVNELLADLNEKGAAQGGQQVVGGSKVATEALPYAVIVVAIVPMMIIYPFVQKFFEKGVTMGSVKG